MGESSDDEDEDGYISSGADSDDMPGNYGIVPLPVGAPPPRVPLPLTKAQAKKVKASLRRWGKTLVDLHSKEGGPRNPKPLQQSVGIPLEALAAVLEPGFHAVQSPCQTNKALLVRMRAKRNTSI